MGFNFRKTINLGNGFKINLSKSGIGYSFGIPGVRYSQSATGKKKMTYSIPGTGISYSNDLSSSKKKKQSSKKSAIKPSKPVENEQVSVAEWKEDLSNCDEFIYAINDFRKKDKLITAFIIIFTIFLLLLTLNPLVFIGGILIFGVYFAYREKYLKINAEYDFDEINAKYYELMQSFFKEIASTEKLWIVNTKYNKDRVPTKMTIKTPYYLRTNISNFCLSINDKEIYFLPNKVLFQDIQSTSGVDFSELEFDFRETAYAEQGNIPNDSETSGYTWLYTNKNGEPDKRYKNNPKFPKCSYGIINIKAPNGFNIILMLSSKKRTEQAKTYYETMNNLSIRETKICSSCNEEISIDANFCKYCGAKQE